jgi:hypothetical protein
MIMKKFRILFLLPLVMLGFLNNGFGQLLIPKKCYMHLVGRIDKQYPFEMELIKNGDTVFGECSFRGGNELSATFKDTSPILSFSGKVTKDAGFKITLDPWEKKILLTGHFVSTQSLSGILEIPGNPNKLPVELTEKYPEGSIPMNAYFQKGSVPLMAKKRGSPVARILLSMLLPGESANPLISDSLKRHIISKFSDNDIGVSDPEKILETIRQNYFNTYINNNIDIYDKSSGQSFDWEMLKYMHVVHNASFILSFYVEQYAFTGGAHGLQARRYTVVNQHTGKVISLHEIFLGNYESKLTELLTNKTREKYKVPENQTLVEAGFFVTEIRPTENFYVTAEGVGFFYNQYDIAPYANGSTDLFIPFKELKEILVSEGILKGLVH